MSSYSLPGHLGVQRGHAESGDRLRQSVLSSKGVIFIVFRSHEASIELQGSRITRTNSQYQHSQQKTDKNDKNSLVTRRGWGWGGQVVRMHTWH